MRTVLSIATKGANRIVAAIDCDEFTPAVNAALITLLLKRIAAKLNPTVEKIAAQDPNEMMDYLLERGWAFELKEQFNEARIIEPQQENPDGKK